MIVQTAKAVYREKLMDAKEITCMAKNKYVASRTQEGHDF